MTAVELSSNPVVQVTAAHGGSALVLATDFGLKVEVVENMGVSYFLLTPCCGQRVMWAHGEAGKCRLCKAPTLYADSLPASASRTQLEEILPQWLACFFDPLTLVLLETPLADRLHTMQAELASLADLEQPQAEKTRAWNSVCSRASGSLFL